MPLMLTNDKKKQVKRKPAKGKRSVKVKDYGNDPFFVKKAEESKTFLEQHGFPQKMALKK